MFTSGAAASGAPRPDHAVTAGSPVRSGGASSSIGSARTSALIPSDDMKSAHLRMSELFYYWLALQDTQSLVQGMVADLKASKPLEIPMLSVAHASRTHVQLASPAHIRTPPLSPSKKMGRTSPASPRHFTFGTCSARCYAIHSLAI